jgi:hypothetical protein
MARTYRASTFLTLKHLGRDRQSNTMQRVKRGGRGRFNWGELGCELSDD